MSRTKKLAAVFGMVALTAFTSAARGQDANVNAAAATEQSTVQLVAAATTTNVIANATPSRAPESTLTTIANDTAAAPRFTVIEENKESGYFAIRMNPPRNEKEALTRPANEVLFQGDDTVAVLNFVNKDKPRSVEQAELLQKYLRQLADKETVHVKLTYIEAPLEHYGGALMAMLQTGNNLGANNGDGWDSMPFDFEKQGGTAPVDPWATVSDGDEFVADIAMGAYVDGVPEKEIRMDVVRKLSFVILRAQERMDTSASAQPTNAPLSEGSPTLAQGN